MSFAGISRIFPTTVDSTLNLRELARAAVGAGNYYNICSTIPFEKLKYRTGIGQVMYLRLVPCLDWETPQKVDERLAANDYILGDAGELAQFMRLYPKEVEKYSGVLALDEGSRWKNSDKDICVCYGSVKGSKRSLGCCRFDGLLNPEYRVLVFEKTDRGFFGWFRKAYKFISRAFGSKKIKLLTGGSR